MKTIKTFLIILFLCNNCYAGDSSWNSYVLIATHQYLDDKDKSTEHYLLTFIKLYFYEDCPSVLNKIEKAAGIKNNTPGVVAKCFDGDEIYDNNLALTVDERFLPLFNHQQTDLFYIAYTDSAGHSCILVNGITSMEMKQKDLNIVLDSLKKWGIKDLYISYPVIEHKYSDPKQALLYLQKKNPNVDKLEFLHTYIKALKMFHTTELDLRQTYNNTKWTFNKSKAIGQMQQSVKKALLVMQSGRELAENFKHSKNSWIQTSANVLNGTFLIQSQIDDEYLDRLGVMEDKNDKTKIKEYKIQSYGQEFLKFSRISDQCMKRLMVITVLLSYILEDDNKYKNGKLGVLVMTTEQKMSFLKDLEDIYGIQIRDDVARPLAISNLEYVTANLYHFLDVGGFKTIDEAQ